jgi:hypothetical protein
MKTNPNEPLNCNNGNGFWREVNNVNFGSGLTKREYFAAIAMQGFLSNSYNDGHSKPYSLANYSEIATLSVKQADSLIAALNGEESEPPPLKGDL